MAAAGLGRGGFGMKLERAGRCLCGAVRFTAMVGDTRFGGCHCTMCQRWGGGPLLAVTVRAEDLRWQGWEHVATFQSSDWAERGWCARCGSNLFYHVTAREGDTSGGAEGDYEMAVGLFDDTSGFELVREIFVDRKPGAYAFAGDHRRLTEAETLALFAPENGREDRS